MTRKITNCNGATLSPLVQYMVNSLERDTLVTGTLLIPINSSYNVFVTHDYQSGSNRLAQDPKNTLKKVFPKVITRMAYSEATQVNG